MVDYTVNERLEEAAWNLEVLMHDWVMGRRPDVKEDLSRKVDEAVDEVEAGLFEVLKDREAAAKEAHRLAHELESGMRYWLAIVNIREGLKAGRSDEELADDREEAYYWREAYEVYLEEAEATPDEINEQVEKVKDVARWYR